MCQSKTTKLYYVYYCTRATCRIILRKDHSFVVPYLYLQNVTKTTQSAYTNDKLHKNNRLREIK